jgi:hypothetical protein
MKTPREELEEYVRALATHVLMADRAYAVLRVIGENARRINEQNLGNLFGYFQIVLADHFGLALTKLFERGSSRNRVRSLPTVLDLLERHAETLNVSAGPRLWASLQALGTVPVRSQSCAAVTGTIIETYRRVMPDAVKSDTCGLSLALKAWRARRDKRTAHDEAVSTTELPSTTWGESQRLLDFAKEFVGTVGWTYLSTAYVGKFGDDDVYLLAVDAERDAMALRRLFVAANIIQEEDS